MEVEVGTIRPRFLLLPPRPPRQNLFQIFFLSWIKSMPNNDPVSGSRDQYMKLVLPIYHENDVSRQTKIKNGF